ncbi:hypothetical protein [Fodinibacter luteus]|uniref:hypothetical protein n=1 Tax=Fodinibacter luteus TaxID=552064 RepID=UPI0031EC7DC8
MRAFVLGAYPSALHVEWTPPPPLGRRIAALPVDNEPYPFWDGLGMDHFVERWRSEHFDPSWGRVRPSMMNGTSGRALHERWLKPLGVDPMDYFVTDCLPTSMLSTGVAKRVTGDGVYASLIDTLGLPKVDMQPHPSEGDIVRRAALHHGRIREQILASGAEILVTLGNAAARVVQQMTGHPEGVLTEKTYRQARAIRIEGRSLTWHALVHPAVRPPWDERHDAWIAIRG